LKSWPLESLKRLEKFPSGLFLVIFAELLNLRRREMRAVTSDNLPCGVCCQWTSRRQWLPLRKGTVDSLHLSRSTRERLRTGRGASLACVPTRSVGARESLLIGSLFHPKTPAPAAPDSGGSPGTFASNSDAWRADRREESY